MFLHKNKFVLKPWRPLYLLH